MATAYGVPFGKEFTVSGDSEHIYVSDGNGRIVATCPSTEDARQIAAALNKAKGPGPQGNPRED